MFGVKFSGSKPGEFTTSLSTVTLQPGGGRRKRSQNDDDKGLNINAAAVARLLPVETTALPTWPLPPLLDDVINSSTLPADVPQLEGSIVRKEAEIRPLSQIPHYNDSSELRKSVAIQISNRFLPFAKQDIRKLINSNGFSFSL